MGHTQFLLQIKISPVESHSIITVLLKFTRLIGTHCLNGRVQKMYTAGSGVTGSALRMYAGGNCRRGFVIQILTAVSLGTLISTLSDNTALYTMFYFWCITTRVCWKVMPNIFIWKCVFVLNKSKTGKTLNLFVGFCTFIFHIFTFAAYTLSPAFK
jgi:hypothetical protein